MSGNDEQQGSAFAGVVGFILAPILGIVAGFVWTWYVGIAVAIGLFILPLWFQQQMRS